MQALSITIIAMLLLCFPMLVGIAHKVLKSVDPERFPSKLQRLPK